MFNAIGTMEIAAVFAVLAMGFLIVAWIIFRAAAHAPVDSRITATPRPLPRDLAEQLAQLTQLHEAGSLTDVEFESAKNAALEGR